MKQLKYYSIFTSWREQRRK